MNVIQTRPVARGNQIRVYLNVSRLDPAPIAIDVDLAPGVRQNLIAAELLALRHALSEMGMGSCERHWHGRGLLLEVTYGAIRKLSRQDSAYQSLAPYAQFLQTRYQGVEIEVVKTSYAWASDDNVTRVVHLGGQPVTERVDTRFGNLVPTLHVLERMVERQMASRLDRAMEVLVNQLTSQDARRLNWGDQAAARCRARYGKHSELILHRGSQNLFVLTKEADGQRRVVTAYKATQYSRNRYGEEGAAA